MPYTVGVDIGGSKIEAALIIADKIIDSKVTKTKPEQGCDEVVERIISTIDYVVTSKAQSIGVGCPGPLDCKNGIIHRTPNLPFKNTPLKGILEKKFKLPVKVDNDASCFVLGEALYGHGQNKNTIAGLTLGTGVGGGLVINKKIYHGKGNACEFGHHTIDYKGPKSKCGNQGCLEEHVSARGLMTIARKHGLEAHSPKKVYQLAVQNNKAAQDTFHEYGKLLGIGITNIIYMLDPDIILLGGKISNSWSFFFSSMIDEIEKRSMMKATIRKSKLRNAALFGAANL